MLKAVKFISLALVLSFFLMPESMDAQRKKKKKRGETTEITPEPPEKDTEKTIADLVKSSKEIDGLFKMYQDTITGALQMEISEDQIDKEYIHFAQVIDGATDPGRVIRGTYGGSYVFKIKKYFNKIEFVSQNTSFYFDPDNAISKSKDANITEGNMASIKVEAYDKEKGLYLIEADGLFLKETFGQIKPSKRPEAPSTAFSLGSLDKDKTKVNEIRNYPENTDVAVEYVYSKPSTLNGGSEAISDGRNVSIKVLHNLIAMPDNDYEIRLDDPRVGYFLTKVTDQTTTGTIPYRDLIHRWNLVKKDPDAAISEPVKPIVFWMENTTPLEWRETIKAAGEKWNVAFEKAGFKNALEVKMQPDDADWDAGDIRYNVLRWTSSPNPLFGGSGPSFVNPKTGEILGADIMLEYVHFTNRVMYDKMYELTAEGDEFNYNEFAEANHLYCSAGHVMHENSLFGQAVITASGGSDLEMEKLKEEAMIALIIHEIGHTLGLMHNMKASQLFTPEQLADADFIEGKCLSGSIMDYAAINLTNDRSKQGQYYDTTVGPYDIWAIQFGYTPFKSEKEREDLLNMSTKPELTFGNDADDMRSPGKAIDPRVNTGDLSNDQIQYSINRFELVNDLMKDVKNKFTVKGESYQELRRVHGILNRHRNGAAKVISRFIGGVYVDRAMAGQQGGTQPFTPVSLEDQKRAMAALNTYVFAPDAYNTPNELYNYLAQQRRGYDFFRTTEDPKIHDQVLTAQKRVLSHLLHVNTLQRITDSELYGNAYSLSAFMRDLNNAIFKADIYGSVNSFRQNLQIEYTHTLIDMLIGKQSKSYTNNSKSMALYNLRNVRNMSAPSGNISSRAHKQHLRTLIDNALKEIK
jgi:hypothetical protein